MLKIIINSDSNLEIDAAVSQQIETDIEKRLGRFEDKITRVVVHLSDENANKEGGQDDKRCMLEARPEGKNAINVTHNAPTVQVAVNHATRKMERLLDETFKRIKDPKGGRPPLGRPE